MLSLEQLLAIIPGHVYWLDKNNLYQGCNETQAKAFGLKSRHEIVGKRNCDLPTIDAATASAWDKNNLEVMEKKLPKIFEEPSILADGTQAVVLSQKIPLFDHQGNVIGLLGVSFDVSELKKEKEELEEKFIQKDLPLEHILAHIPAHVYWKNKEGTYLGCNDSQARTLGMSSGQEIIGKTDFDLPWGSELAKAYRENDLRIMSTGLEERVEETAFINDKKVVYLSLKTPLRNKQAEVIGVLGISIDVTKQKETEKKLLEAIKNSEAANKAKTRFLENMRHDIRTPITGIIGCANLIKNLKNNSFKVEEYADILITSSEALLNFLTEVLDSIRVSSGDVPLLRKKFDLNATLKKVIKLNQSKALERNLLLKLEHDSAISKYLIGDPSRIHRIALELVTNALKYTEKGHVIVRTKLAKKDHTNLVIKIIVEDTGIGIPANEQQEIFVQFKRLTPSFQGIYQGSGLGLALVKEFLQDLDAEIYVSSEVNKGSTFTCIIPIKEALLSEEFGVDTEIEEPYSNVITLSGHPRPSSNIKTNALVSSNQVLLVEDHPITAKITREVLLDFNYQVDIASDGATALSLLEKTSYNIIFIDLGLPDISGYEITEKIRRNEKNQSIPIVGLTAHASVEDKRRCLSVGMNAVFIKPLMKEKMENICDIFLHVPPSSKANKFSEKVQREDNLLVLTGEVIDLKLGNQLANGNEDLAKEFLSMLVNSFPEELIKMEAAYKLQAVETVSSILHKLRGGLSYCGVPRLKEACIRLDEYLKSDQKELIEKLYQQFLSEFNKVKKKIIEDPSLLSRAKT